jgi:hypothetical protein
MRLQLKLMYWFAERLSIVAAEEPIRREEVKP